MSSVEQAIRALHLEILAGLRHAPAGPPLPGNVTLTADRVTLSLALQLPSSDKPGAPAQFCVANDSVHPPHRLTVEFSVTSTQLETPQNSPALPAPEPIATTTPAPETTPTFECLSKVFGPPGFDSSARASIFRETLEELPKRHQKTVLLSLVSEPTAGEPTKVTDTRHRIFRLASLGPAQEQGPALLQQLARTESIAKLITLAADHWRTQSDWASESSPYA